MKHAKTPFSTISEQARGSRWQDLAAERILASGLRGRRSAPPDRRVLGSLAVAGLLLILLGTGLRTNSHLVSRASDSTTILVEKTPQGVRLHWVAPPGEESVRLVVRYRRPGFEAERVLPVDRGASIELSGSPSIPDLQLYRVLTARPPDKAGDAVS